MMEKLCEELRKTVVTGREGVTDLTIGGLANVPTIAETETDSSENAEKEIDPRSTAKTVAAMAAVFLSLKEMRFIFIGESAIYSPPFSPFFIDASNSALSFSRDFGTTNAT